ncbi:MAG: N-glycosyltransferase [Acidithiobacillales bacterium SM23_46]|nr:MAG: N-glycosyltransferase [Acidithiobacillales bacterium SM23_46]
MSISMEGVFYFVFFYPLFMAFFWMIGAVIFFIRHERNAHRPPMLPEYPFISVVVPCHNEGREIEDTIRKLEANAWPDYEIVAVNDGSSDDTGKVLDRLAQRVKRLRVVHLDRNFGKAMALRAGAYVARGEYLMCIDADTRLDHYAMHWMMAHMLNGARVGAVTGNPRILNRGSLLSRIQIGEFSSIIGMVRRSQRDVGRVFTVSGCHVCFRRRALHEVGYWSAETVTEDIDISWKLQLHYWDVRYEPRALAWIVMPETLRGLWRQRLRWAQGGIEAALKYASLLQAWTKRRMWPVYVEYLIGAIWCYAWAATVLCWIGTQLLPESWPAAFAVASILPKWTGVILAFVCLLQFMVGLYLDNHYEKGIFRNMFWAIWYPAMYWMISAIATIVAIPRAIYFRGKVRYATWRSPERGVA